MSQFVQHGRSTEELQVDQRPEIKEEIFPTLIKKTAE